MPMPPRAKQVSDEVVILTRKELAERERQAFLYGVERGRFEESCDRSDSKARGSEGHLGATESTGSAPSDAAVRPANSSQ